MKPGPFIKQHYTDLEWTLKNTEWDSAKLATKEIKKEVSELKQQPGKDILVGSRSLIIQLINFNLIDEFQICIYPMIEGKGLQLFDKIKDRAIFRLLKTKIFLDKVYM